MGHITGKSYLKLQKRLDKPPQGAPPSEALFKILEHIFSEKEAELLSVLPINYFTIEKAAEIWKCPTDKAKKTINSLADKGIIVDFGDKFAIAPTMAGFFEFTIMKMGGRFDKKLLSELYYQYVTKEDEFGKRVFTLYPPIARTFVNEDVLEEKDKDIIMDYEKATQVVESNDFWAVTTCYCRHKMEHLGKACDMPQDVCLAFGSVARSLVKHGFARSISKQKTHEIIKKCRDLGLVQVGSNIQNEVSWICNCCGCCCEALLAYKKFRYNPRIESNFFAKIDQDKCTNCGLCKQKCPVNVIGNDQSIKPEECLGCGVCARFCPSKAITMKRREKLNFTPKDGFERIILEAIDSGTLQNLIIDNYELWHYGILRKFLSIIFVLPPTKWMLANKQLQSRFLTAVGNHYYNKNPELFNYEKPDYTHPELKKRK